MQGAHKCQVMSHFWLNCNTAAGCVMEERSRVQRPPKARASRINVTMCSFFWAWSSCCVPPGQDGLWFADLPAGSKQPPQTPGYLILALRHTHTHELVSWGEIWSNAGKTTKPKKADMFFHKFDLPCGCGTSWIWLTFYQTLALLGDIYSSANFHFFFLVYNASWISDSLTLKCSTCFTRTSLT